MPPMEDVKVEKISVSMPKHILDAMERHVASIPSESRSGWLTGLAVRELESVGVLGDSQDIAKLTAKVAAALRKDPTLTPHIEKVLSKATRRMVAA